MVLSYLYSCRLASAWGVRSLCVVLALPSGLSLPLGCLLAVYLFVGFNVGVLDVDGGTTGGVQTAARRVRSNLSVIATGGAEDKLTASIAGDIFSAGGRCVAKHPLGI